MNLTRLAVVIAAVAAPMMVTYAQEKTTLLDTMTVVGTRTETTVRDNPASVSVVEREQIEKRGADSVAELLRDVPGVSVVDTAVAGMKRIRIRGEQSNRVVILVDGQEMTDHSSFGAPFLIDPFNIERIEVVRGPASVMHGAKAIGGVINVITKKGAADPVVVELGAGYFSGSKGKQVSAAVSGTLDRFDYRLSVSGDDHKDRRVAKGRHSPDSKKLPNSGSENKDASLHLGVKLGERENHYLSFKANEHRLKADGWEDNFSLVKGFNARDIAMSISDSIGGMIHPESTLDIVRFNANLPKRDLKKVGLYYEGIDLGPLVRKVTSDFFYQKVDRKFANDITLDGPGVTMPSGSPAPVIVNMQSNSVDTTKTFGGSTQIDFSLLENHYTVAGAQFLKDTLDTDKLTQPTVTVMSPVFPGPLPWPGPGPYPITPSISATEAFDKATMQTTSAFLQDEWTLPNDFKLIGGVRYYHVKSKLDKTSSTNHAAGEKSTHSRFVKSLGLTWTGLNHTTLRAGYSEGYVMPTLLEQFTDSRAGRGITLHGNPDLSPERSQSFDLGLRYQNRGVVFDGTLFYTKSKQYITFESCANGHGCSGGDIYVNADKAKSYGLELLIEYWLKDTPYTPYLTTTLMRRKITVDDFSTYKTDVPAISGDLGMRYERSFAGTDLWADAFVQASSKTDKKERDILKSGKESRHLSGWSTLNFAVGGNFGDEGQHRLALHLNNLNNRHYRASVDEMPATGRNFVVTFNTSL